VIAKATATRAKGTFLQAKYYRLVKRMPKQKALGAVAHRLLVISYHLLSRGVPYAELGSVPLDPQQVDRHRRRLMYLTSKSCWGVVLMYGGKDTSKERYKSFLIVAFAKADDVNRWHKPGRGSRAVCIRMEPRPHAAQPGRSEAKSKASPLSLRLRRSRGYAQSERENQQGLIREKVAIGILGFSAVHYPTSMQEIEFHDAATDLLVADTFEMLGGTYPGSKFIYTVRERTKWLESCRRHWRKRGPSMTFVENFGVDYTGR
jgi:hypothetical protein